VQTRVHFVEFSIELVESEGDFLLIALEDAVQRLPLHDRHERVENVGFHVVFFVVVHQLSLLVHLVEQDAAAYDFQPFVEPNFRPVYDPGIEKFVKVLLQLLLYFTEVFVVLFHKRLHLLAAFIHHLNVFFVQIHFFVIAALAKYLFVFDTAVLKTFE